MSQNRRARVLQILPATSSRHNQTRPTQRLIYR